MREMRDREHEIIETREFRRLSRTRYSNGDNAEWSCCDGCGITFDSWKRAMSTTTDKRASGSCRDDATTEYNNYPKQDRYSNEG